MALTPATLEEVFNSDITGADCVEVRLDYLKRPQQSRDVSWTRLGVPVIATCRRRERGGFFDGSPEDERDILNAAARLGAKYVDMDYRDARRIDGAQLIASYHNFDETPSDVQQHLQAACSGPADIGKVATTVRSWSDNRRLIDLLDRPWSKPVITAGMGEMGSATRIIGPSRGSYLTYATIPQNLGPSAAGQLTLSEMIQAYRFRRIRRTTELFGVVGNPVSHSSGPSRHNAAFEAAGLDCAYLKFLVTDVGDFFENAHAIGIRGFSVTMPHKTAVIPYLADLTDEAQEAGAVNTVKDMNGAWIGDNTDVHGVREALKQSGFNISGKRVVILGNGGASRAAVVAVKGADSVVVLPRAEVKNVRQYPCDLLINATPVGMVPNIDASPVEGEIPANAVFDMVYTPSKTRLLQMAEEQGKHVIGGLAMYFAQAARQFEIWTGVKAPTGSYTT